MKNPEESETIKSLQKSMEAQGYRLHSYRFFYIPCWIYSAEKLMKFAEDGLKNQKKILKFFFPRKLKSALITKVKYDIDDLNLDPIALLYGLSFENLFKAILIKQGKIKSHKDSRESSHYLSKMAKKIGLNFSQNEAKWIAILEHKVIWDAKYPAPTDPKDFFFREEDGRIPIFRENLYDYFELKKLYQKILKFLKDQQYYSNALEELHLLSKKRSKLHNKQCEIINNGMTISDIKVKKIALKRNETDIEIEKIIRILNTKYEPV